MAYSKKTPIEDWIANTPRTVGELESYNFSSYVGSMALYNFPGFTKPCKIITHLYECKARVKLISCVLTLLQ